MSVYNTGTVNLISGSPYATGYGTSWLSEITAGKDIFIKRGDSVPFLVAGVSSDTQIQLSTNWPTGNVSGALYDVFRDFTANAGLAKLYGSDRSNWPVIIARNLDQLDNWATGYNEVPFTCTWAGNYSFTCIDDKTSLFINSLLLKILHAGGLVPYTVITGTYSAPNTLVTVSGASVISAPISRVYHSIAPQGPPGPTGAIGPQGPQGTAGGATNWRSVWISGTSYIINDAISYNGSSYICISGNSAYAPTDETYWNLLAQKGDQGIQGISGTAGPQGATGPAGPSGTESLLTSGLLASDHSAKGMIYTRTAFETLDFGDPVYFKSNGQVGKASAISGSNSIPCIGLNVTASIVSGNTASILERGVARDDSWTWTIGGRIYLSEIGGLTQTVVTGTDTIFQVLGTAFPNTHTLDFNPSSDYYTHT